MRLWAQHYGGRIFLPCWPTGMGGWERLTRERAWEAELHRLKGELMLPARPQYPVPGNDLSHTAEAEACLHQALAVARRQQAKSWELRAATSLARLSRNLRAVREGRKGGNPQVNT